LTGQRSPGKGEDRSVSLGEESAADGGGVAGGTTADTVEEAERSISELCASDWGLWRTFTADLQTLGAHLGRYELTEESKGRVGTWLGLIEEEPEAFGWKMRPKTDDRKRWYELPEEVDGGP
jgi:hypothetical protein